MIARSALAALLLVPCLAAAETSPTETVRVVKVVTLDEAVQSALSHQPQLTQAVANAKAGVARADEARAGLLPQVNATGQVSRTQTTTTQQGVLLGQRVGSSTTIGNTWLGQVSVGQVLFDPGTFFSWRSAGESAQSLRDTADSTRLDVVSAVQSAYFTARADRDLVKVARETVDNDEAHLHQTEAFVEVGTQPLIALAQSRSALASAQLALIQAQNAYATARAQLAQAMGLETWGEFEVGDDTLPPVRGEEGALEPLLEEALAARPELASLGAQERSAEESRTAARSGYLPLVSAQGTYAEIGPTPDATKGSWSVGLNLTWNLFGGGITSAKVRESEANLDSLRAQEVGLRTSIRVALEQAVLGVRAAISSVDAAKEAETNAREQLRLAEGRYQAGVGSIIELGDAQVGASNAAAQRVQAEYNVSAARAALLRALGRAP
ncbi:MAG TPA: TolC family protein [Anaeromyxobacter sp.]|nr:TolC family protein [Anaeromyxobacter sp.]